MRKYVEGTRLLRAERYDFSRGGYSAIYIFFTHIHYYTTTSPPSCMNVP